MENKQLIDFEELERHIKKVEYYLTESAGLNVIEQNLVLTQTLTRLQMKQKNQQAQDMMQNISLTGLLKRITKSRDDK